MNILVTGGAGFIGSHTILELLNEGHQVICVDNSCNSFISAKGELPESMKRVEDITGKKVIFYMVDIRDKKALNEVFQKVSLYSIVLSLNKRNRWWSRQMCSFGTIPVFISDVPDLDQLAAWQIVAVSTFLNQNVCCSFLVRYQRSLFRACHSIACQEVVRILAVIISDEVILENGNLFLGGRGCDTDAN